MPRITTPLHDMLRAYDHVSTYDFPPHCWEGWQRALHRPPTPDEETIIALSIGYGDAPSIPQAERDLWMNFHAHLFNRGQSIHPRTVCRWLGGRGHLPPYLWAKRSARRAPAADYSA